MAEIGSGPFKFPSSNRFVRLFQSGDRAALQTVYLAYVEEVDGAVQAFLRSQHFGTAATRWTELEDLIQDVFARAFSVRARASFDVTRPYGPFLGTLTRNLLIDWARRRGREPPVQQIETIPDAVGPSDSTSDGNAEIMAVVEKYLSGLPGDLRGVHEARYVLALSQEDACKRLGLSRQQLRTREKRLKVGLQREIKRAALRKGVPALGSNRTTPATNG